MNTARASFARLPLAALTAALLFAPACFDGTPSTSSVDNDEDAQTSSGTDPETSATSGDNPAGTTGDDTSGTSGPGTSGTDDTSGGGGSSSAGDDGSSGQGGSTTASADTTPPQVLSITPADGTTAVTGGHIEIAFDEPVDTTTVETAFPDGEGFTWNDDDSAVEFDLDLPFAETQSSFDIVVPTSVTDVAGNELEAEALSTVALAALHNLVVEHDPNLTGNNTGTWFYAGDTPEDTDRYGGATFGLGTLPDHDSILELRSATLATQVLDVEGTPDAAAAGGYVIDHVEFASRGAIASPVMRDPAFAQFLSSAEIEPGGTIAVDVAEQLEASWSDDEVRFQIRVRLANVTNNGVADVAWFRRGADENDGIVADGVTEPDASHRLRLMVEYFTEL